MNTQPDPSRENIVSAASEPPPLARLDVTTWTVHNEPPSTVNAASDSRARWYFAFSEVTGWALLPFFLIFVVPSLNDVATLDPRVLIVGTVGGLATAVAAILRHRALRKITGAPVIAELHEILDVTAEVLAAHRASFHELSTLTGVDTAEQAKARKVARGGLKNQRQLRRHVLRHCELAALAERQGRIRSRDRQVRKITEMCLILCRPYLDDTEHSTEAEDR